MKTPESDDSREQRFQGVITKESDDSRVLDVSTTVYPMLFVLL